MKECLTDEFVVNLRTGSKRYEVADELVTGLRIRIGTGGTKTFILRKRVSSEIISKTIGSFDELKLNVDTARMMAGHQAVKNSQGREFDSITRCSQTVESVRLDTLVEEFLRHKSNKKSIREIKRIFANYIMPAFRGRSVSEIRRHEITRLLDSIAYDEVSPAPSMARAVASQLSSFYSWAMCRVEGVDFNPCIKVGKPDRSKPRQRVLTNAELVALWKVLDTEKGNWGAAVKILILTGQRRSEVFGAEHREFDFSQRLWTIPGSRTKNGHSHVVPLSMFARETLLAVANLEATSKIFRSRDNPDVSFSGYSKALTRTLKKLRMVDDGFEPFTLHDLRRTLATGLQRLGTRVEVTEAVLNHVSGTRGGIVGVYQRHDYSDEKRSALEAWSREVQRIVRA